MDIRKILNAVYEILGSLASFVGQFSDVAANALNVLQDSVLQINDQIEEGKYIL